MAEETFVGAARRAGVTDDRVLQALADVPRRLFVPEGYDALVDADAPVPLPFGQTTSQPSLVALMVEALELTPQARVLEIGTGYGFEAAVLSRLAMHVWSVEWWPELATAAAANLEAFGANNVDVITGDGRDGAAEHAPFDAIVVAARADEVPVAVVDQLAVGGRLVVPLGPQGSEVCTVFTKNDDGEVVEVRRMGQVRFVPLVGP